MEKRNISIIIALVVLISVVGYFAISSTQNPVNQTSNTTYQIGQNDSSNNIQTNKVNKTRKTQNSSKTPIVPSNEGPDTKCPECGSLEYYDTPYDYNEATGITIWNLKCLKCNSTWTVKTIEKPVGGK